MFDKFFGKGKPPPPPPPAEKDKGGRYPAWYAAMEGDIPTLQAALEGGLDPNHKDRKGYTMLAIASFYGRTDAVRLLLEAGADPNITNSFGNGPLWEATREASMITQPGQTPYDKQVVALLLQAGADPAAKNKADTFPAGWAHQSPELQAMSRAAGYEGDFPL